MNNQPLTRTVPELSSEREYAKIYADTAIWLPAAQLICQRHRLDPADLRRTTLGTHIVFRTGQRIVKLFSRLWPDDFTAERAALGSIGNLPVPELVAEGEVEGWPYLVMTALPGIPAAELWNHLDQQHKTSIVGQLGRLMARLHEHPPVPELATHWNAFLEARIARAERHHAAGDPWRSWIRHRIAGFCEPSFEPVLLNADITADHLLLSQRQGRWQITGLIDFGDARMGHPHYEFIAPLAFYTFGNPDLSLTLVEAYGLRPNDELTERLTTYCLLHEFGRLRDFLDRHPAADGPAFHQALWGNPATLCRGRPGDRHPTRSPLWPIG